MNYFLDYVIQRPKKKILAEETSYQNELLTGSTASLMGQVFHENFEKPNYEPEFKDSVAGIALERDLDVMEVMYDLLVQGEGKELFYQP